MKITCWQWYLQWFLRKRRFLENKLTESIGKPKYLKKALKSQGYVIEFLLLKLKL